MTNLDPARVLIVDAISTLEQAIEELMPAQAPGSSEDDIKAGVQTLMKTNDALGLIIDQVAAVIVRGDDN